MKSLHITDLTTFQEFANGGKFDPEKGGHYIDLPTGEKLVVAHFRHEEHEWSWYQHPNVQSLPHPAYEGSKPLDAKHQEKIKHLGINPSDTIIDVFKKLGKDWTKFRLAPFSS